MSKPFHIFMLVKTTARWLALTPAQRFGFLDQTIRPILGKHPEVRMRFFDIEAFSARVSDLILWETTDLPRYQSLVEHLRETPFWDGYFEVLEILPGLENAYADHYRVAPVQV